MALLVWIILPQPIIPAFLAGQYNAGRAEYNAGVTAYNATLPAIGIPFSF